MPPARRMHHPESCGAGLIPTSSAKTQIENERVSPATGKWRGSKEAGRQGETDTPTGPRSTTFCVWGTIIIFAYREIEIGPHQIRGPVPRIVSRT